jgi:rubredoxin
MPDTGAQDRRTLRPLQGFRCTSCGYGARAAAAPSRCPMCGGESWEPEGWRPFTQLPHDLLRSRRRTSR